jgi:hypothetical protein
MRLPTERRAYTRGSRSLADPEMPTVSIDISDVSLPELWIATLVFYFREPFPQSPAFCVTGRREA